MTTVDAPNAHAVAIEGTFDDCQDLVKALFADAGLRRDLGLSAMNSINFARIAAQIVYYVAAGLALGARKATRCRSRVPTDIFRQYLRRASGVFDGSADRAELLVLATNANDIPGALPSPAALHDDGPRSAKPQPRGMDIQVASNFERLLFELKDRQRRRRVASHPANVPAAPMARCRPTTRPGTPRAALLPGTGLTMRDTLDAMAATYKRTGMLVDPHTAIGIAAARAHAGGENDTARRW